MNTLTKRGMTLFELLAVIVILGIVAAIAFPTVNSLINNTKKDAIAANANTFIQTAITNVRTDYNSMQYGDLADDSKTYIVYVDASLDTSYPTTVTVTDTDFQIDLSDDFLKLDKAYLTITISDDGTNIVLSTFVYIEGDYGVDEGTVADEDTPITRKHVIDSTDVTIA